MRTFLAPPATPAAPIERSITQPGNAAPIGQTGIRPGLFGGGLFGGLAAGFLGAGVFGLLFGHGLFGGMAGFASMIGLLLQVVLVVIVARLVFAWWQRRNMPTPAYAAAHPVTGHSFGGLSGMLGGPNVPPAGDHLTIAKPDYDAFEGLLGDIQADYSTEDLSALRTQVTPEMLSYFSEQLAGNASRGLINRAIATAKHENFLPAYRHLNSGYAMDNLKRGRPAPALSRHMQWADYWNSRHHHLIAPRLLLAHSRNGKGPQFGDHFRILVAGCCGSAI